MRGIPFYVGLLTGIVVEELKKRKIKWSKVIFTQYFYDFAVFFSVRARRVYLLIIIIIILLLFFSSFFSVRGLHLDFRHIRGVRLGSILRRRILREAQALQRRRTSRVRDPQPLHVDRHAVLDNYLSLDFWLRYVT